MRTIQGDIKPKAEQKTLYELSTIILNFTSSVFSPQKEEKYVWTLYKLVNNQWKKVENNVKYGEKNTYQFGQGVVGIPFKIMVHSEEKDILQVNRNKLIAELKVIPKTAKEPVIGRVILLNKGNKDVNKAKFNEHLTAQARTSNLLGKEITFYLWEEGASEFEKYKNPKKARVNKHGIAEVQFNLSEYASPATFMIFFGGNNATKKFFVTATYEGKGETNKTPVTATDRQQQTPKTNTISTQQKPQQPSTPQPTQAPNNQDAGIIAKSREIIAEGIGNFFNAIENSISAAQVGTTQRKEEKKNCICQEQYKDLIWGGKVSCQFRKKVMDISKRLGIDPNNFMAAMAHETGGTFDPKCGTFKKHKNEKKEGYVGLIQIGKDAAKSIGITRTELFKMNQLDQLDYVEKYLAKKKGKLNTLTDFYLAILFPVDCGKGNQPNHIVFDKSLPISYKNGEPIKDLNYWRNVAYSANPAFHKEGKKENGKTYIWEIAENIQIWYEKGKNNKSINFACNKETQTTKSTKDKGTWYVIITEKYTGSKCTHIEKTPIRANCRRGKIDIYDHNIQIILTISDCLLEGIAGEDRTIKDSDAPYGTYQISAEPFIMGSSSGDSRTTYGPNPRLSFEPIKGSGDEADKSRRSLIRVHGGRQETKKFNPRVNPNLLRTHGCIRIWDADAKKFYDWWVEYHKNNPTIKPGKLTIKK